MELNQIKRVAASVMHAGMSKIKIVDAEKAAQAMTKEDVRDLIKQGAILKKKTRGTSRGRARKRRLQRKRGLKRGIGKRRGGRRARGGKKMQRMHSVRALRKELGGIKPNLKSGLYRKLYKMTGSGFFKDKKYMLTYIKEKKMLKE